MNRKNRIGVAVWLALVVITGYLAFGFSPGLMGYSPWHEDRPGPWDEESNLFGGYEMGPGMKGGWNMPQGMRMERGDMGFGMTGDSPMGLAFGADAAQLSGLNAEQIQRIGQLQRESNARNSQLAQQAWAAQDTLNRLLMSENREWDAIRTASQAILESRRQQIDSNIDLQKKIDGVLTDSQRWERARNWRGYGSRGAQ